MNRVVVAGGNGWLGRALTAELRALGLEPIVLSRKPGPNQVEWDGETVGGWAASLEGALAVVNLSGESIFVPWTRENRRRIVDSRTRSTEAIGLALSRLKKPPKVWINGSATGYYGDRLDEILTEASAHGDGFLSDVCQAWEAAHTSFTFPDVRMVRIRTGVVLGRGGGALAPMTRLTKLFMGGPQGHGDQYVPWVHIDDLVHLILWAIASSRAQGVYNGVAPEPVTNADLMAALRKTLGRPWAPRVPVGALRLVGRLGGPDPDLVLDSVRAVPVRALDEGFDFTFPYLRHALDDLFGTHGDAGKGGDGEAAQVNSPIRAPEPPDAS